MNNSENDKSGIKILELAFDGNVAEKQEEGYQIWSQQAWDWAINPTSIPGAHAPILYTGPQVFEEIAFAQHRTLSLEDAMNIVQPDGKKQVCARTGDEFQPVKYIPYISADLKQQLEMKGVHLRDCKIHFDGSFYCDTDNKPVAISGARYLWNGKDGRYQYDLDSKLLEAAIATGKKFVEEALAKNLITPAQAKEMSNKKVWAKPYDYAMRHVLRKESRIEATKLADRLLVVQHGIKALTFSAQNELKRVA